MDSILKIIEEQKELEQTEDLILDEIRFDSFTNEIKSKIEQINDLSYLTLNDCNIKSIETLP